MENTGIIQKDGAGKYTRYVKALIFHRLSRAAKVDFTSTKISDNRLKNIKNPCNNLVIIAGI